MVQVYQTAINVAPKCGSDADKFIIGDYSLAILL